MNTITKRIITALILATVATSVYLFAPAWVLSALLVAIVVIIFTYEWPQFLAVDSWDYWLVGGTYIIVPFGFMIYLNQTPQYRALFALALLLVAAHDTGSYFFGKWLGKRIILPHISPRKTWEGFVGGCITACAVFVLYCNYNQLSVPWLSGLLLVLKICYIALIGDLFESWLKRSSSLKDSGTLLPGHGGFLDRFDALMFVIIYVFIMKDYIVTILG